MRASISSRRYPRRAVLSGGAATFGLLAGVSAVTGAGAAVLTGCDLGKPKPPPAPNPLLAVREQARALASRYDAVIAAVPDLAGRLRPLREAHGTHVAELSRVIGTPAPSAPASVTGSVPAVAAADPGATLADLRTAEEAARQAAAAVCLAVPAARAALVGSIAACRASHVEALR